LRKYKNPMVDLKWIPILIPDKKNWTPHIYKWKTIYLKTTRDLKVLLDRNIPKYKYKNNFWAEAYMNEAISSLYEPGSIMKAITVAIWIETWEIHSTDFYYDKWFVKIDQFTIKNVMSACSWYHTYWHALNYSCNVWMIDIARKVWKTMFHSYLKKFWFSNPTNITLTWEVSWDLKPFSSRAQLFTSSYWLWVNVNPLQMVMAYSVIANGWILYKPKIVDSITYVDKKSWEKIVIKEKPEIITRVIKESTSKEVTKMLVDSVNKWVAKNWKVPWFLLAWKTWTSDIASRWKYEKWVWSTNASFAWFWPAQDPQFVILVKLRRPRTVKYGWESSAYMFSELAEYLLNYYWVSSNDKFK
jgi:cell division protein FtsI/penicillin-binding protein 2